MSPMRPLSHQSCFALPMILEGQGIVIAVTGQPLLPHCRWYMPRRSRLGFWKWFRTSLQLLPISLLRPLQHLLGHKSHHGLEDRNLTHRASLSGCIRGAMPLIYALRMLCSCQPTILRRCQSLSEQRMLETGVPKNLIPSWQACKPPCPKCGGTFIAHSKPLAQATSQASLPQPCIAFEVGKASKLITKLTLSMLWLKGCRSDTAIQFVDRMFHNLATANHDAGTTVFLRFSRGVHQPSHSHSR